MPSSPEWMFNKRQFILRMTFGVGLVATLFMILFLEVYSPEFAVLWAILALVGLLGGYMGSVLMWKFYALPIAQQYGFYLDSTPSQGTGTTSAERPAGKAAP